MFTADYLGSVLFNVGLKNKCTVLQISFKKKTKKKQADQWRITPPYEQVSKQGVWKSRTPSAPLWSWNFEMNELMTKKNLGLQTLRWSRKFFSDTLFLRAIIIPRRPRWANACLQTKMVPKNLIWSESAQWLLSYGIRKIPGALIMPMGKFVHMLQEYSCPDLCKMGKQSYNTV